MKRVVLALAIIGFVCLAIGIAISFSDPLLQHQVTIPSSGRVVYPGEESKSSDNNSQMYAKSSDNMLFIAGLGLLSITLLGCIKKSTFFPPLDQSAT